MKVKECVKHVEAMIVAAIFHAGSNEGLASISDTYRDTNYRARH